MAIIIIVSRPRGSAGIVIPAEYIKASQFDLMAGFVLSVPDSKSLTLRSGGAKRLLIGSVQTTVSNIHTAKAARLDIGACHHHSIWVSGKLTPACTGVQARLPIYQAVGNSCMQSKLDVIDRSAATIHYHKYIGVNYAANS